MTTRRKLIIVGGGDFAGEYLWTASRVPAEARDWDVHGVLDDDVAAARARLDKGFADTPVLGTIRDHVPAADERFICSIGSPAVKLAVCEGLVKRGAVFTNLIDPTALVAPTAVLGVGVFLFLHAVVSVGARVGDHVAVNCHSSIGHDAVVEDGCTLSSYCDVTGHVRLGRGALLGSHATVLPKARVGAGSLVGAGSVVLRSVPERESVFGVPARRV